MAYKKMDTDATPITKWINYGIFAVMFGVVVFLDANLFWKIGLETMPVMGVVLMVVFSVGHISRTFIRPILIFSILSVIATTGSISLMGNMLFDSNDSKKGHVSRLEADLAAKGRELKRLEENGNYSERSAEINAQIAEIKNSSGWTNSMGDKVGGSLWALTNQCRGGTGNSNWYLNNRAAMSQGCNDIESLQQKLLLSAGQSINKLEKEISQLRKDIQIAKNKSKGVGKAVVEGGEAVSALINHHLLSNTSFSVDFFTLTMLFAALTGILIEYLFQKHSPARFKPVSKPGSVLIVLKRAFRYLAVWLWRKRKNDHTRKAQAEINQQVSANSPVTQDELTKKSKPTHTEPELVSKPFQASDEDVCRELVNVRPETLGDYLETLPELTEGVSLVIAYLMIFYGEKPEAGRVLANAKASDLIRDRENTAPSWAKAIFSGTGVNHKYVGKAKEVLADNGYLLKKVKTGKRTLTFYDWKPPAKVAAIIRSRRQNHTLNMGDNVVALRMATR